MTVLIESHNTEQHCFLEPNKHKISSLSFTEDRCVNICTILEPLRSLQSPRVMGQIRDSICGIWRKRSPPPPPGPSLVFCKWIRVFDIAHVCARRPQPGHAVRSRNRRPLITPSCACAVWLGAARRACVVYTAPFDGSTFSCAHLVPLLRRLAMNMKTPNGFFGLITLSGSRLNSSHIGFKVWPVCLFVWWIVFSCNPVYYYVLYNFRFQRK